ncbi:hypothetical protein [Salinisphaera hydrothermalis]|uniref:hypothetical protein n=1 Tax=Salinisphaera hydrothermalis TaxID=563188 RepID=UPI0012EC3008|nr:hypothetical protein [Salinisphaera hydrothermalis]
MDDSYQYEMRQGERPRFLDDGDKAVLVDRREYRLNAERALIAQFVCQRRLFGMVYSRLCREVFDSLKEGGGVFLGGLVPSEKLSPNLKYPGDIDLLAIPYQDNKLLVDKTLGVEIKII